MQLNIGGFTITVDDRKHGYLGGYLEGYQAKITGLDKNFFESCDMEVPIAPDFTEMHEESEISKAEAIGNLVLKITKNGRHIDRHLPEEYQNGYGYDLEPYHD